MKVEATAKAVRISSRKARLVIDQVRGMSVVQAESVLKFMNKKAAEIVLRVLQSAAANAQHNHNLAKKDLKISEITANEGFTIKRYRPRAFGRASQIRKRTSHIRVVVEETEEAKQAKAAKAKAKKATKKSPKKSPKKSAAAGKDTKAGTEKQKPAKKKTAAKKPVATKKTKKEIKK